MEILSFVAFSWLLCAIAANDIDKPDSGNVGQLMTRLFKNYDKEIMPDKPVIVSVNMLLMKVKTIVEREGIFESVLALFLKWHDERITWNPADYNNITEITCNSERIWLPDVAMTNSADHTYSISKDTTFVIRANYKGVFDFVPTGTAKTWCDLHLLSFPFDIQTCAIEFESWALNFHSLRFDQSAKVLLHSTFSSLQFSLCSFSINVSEAYYEMTAETFSRLTFSFMVKRKSSFYLTHLIFPIATLSLLQPLVFFIPVRDSSSDRINFGTTNLLTLVVFQTVITEEMPKTVNAITALSKYIMSLVVLSVWAISESIIIQRVVRITEYPPPSWLSAALRKICPLKIGHNSGVDESTAKERRKSKRCRKCKESVKAPDDKFFVVERSPMRARRDLQPCRSPSLSSPVWVPQNPAASAATMTSLLVENDDVPMLPSPLHMNKTKYPVISSQRPPEYTVKSSASARRPSPDVKDPRKNKERWGDVAARVDVIMLILSVLLTAAAPAFLFLPIVMFNELCPHELGSYPIPSGAAPGE